MNKNHIKYLVCPDCKGELSFQEIIEFKENEIKSGTIYCDNCRKNFEIYNHIPRFVNRENYASSFGYQWLKHSKTQYDSYSGVSVSEDRFVNETKWGNNLKGEIMLEAGCGAGRFTEQAVKTGALVISFDYSYSVEANYENNGGNENLLILQADIYSMPFENNFFDKVLCIGVLQHTPDVNKSFIELTKVVKKGGSLVVDIYRKYEKFYKTWNSKYVFRFFSDKISSDKLYKFCVWYVDFMRPIAKVLYKLPKGWWIAWKILMIVTYRDRFSFLSEDIQREWCILDTFDKLAPAYDKPQKLDTLKKWYDESGFSEYEVFPGYNGITGRGIK